MKYQNAMLSSYHGNAHLSFLGDYVEPYKAIAENLVDTHARGDVLMVTALRDVVTGHKAFDKKISDGFVGIGNVSSDFMRGQCIRPTNELESNGFLFKPGKLQEADINTFTSHSLRSALSRWVELVPEMKTEMTYAYVFFVQSGYKRLDIGYLLVNARDLRVLRCHTLSKNEKHHQVMDAMRLRLSIEGVSDQRKVAFIDDAGLTVYSPELAAQLDVLGAPYKMGETA